MRHIWPLLIPITAIVVAFIIIYGISRILLSVNNHEVTPFVALGIALVFLLGATAIATRMPDPQGH
ncbi:MAG TPA: hypothetical protein VKX96_10205 [Chloroflexota bacterium]|jgi:hypothetical protein|nr:hypothetical protein [Chloroflexota bacterium]